MNKPRLERLIADWPAKILSLAGAIALFFFYQLNRLEERPLSVPLVVVSNDDYVAASQYPRTVRLVLRGESNAIFAILEDDIEATLDLSGFESAGVYRVPIKIEKRGSALGIDPLEVSVDPSDIAMSIEPRVVKEIQVVPTFRGYLDPGYELAGFKLEPQRIEVAGPASVMDKLVDAATEPIELTGKSENFTVRSRLAVRDPLISFLSSDTVQFSAEVKKAMVFRTYQDLEVVFVGLKDGLVSKTAAPMGSARVAASSLELEAFVPAAGALEADLSRIEAPGVYAVAIVPRFPEGFDVESWMPLVATVAVERAPAGTRSEVVP